MTTSNNPDEIRADIERTRATLSNDVDELAETVNPKHVAQRQVDKVKEAASNVKERVMGSNDDDYTDSAVGAGASSPSAKEAITDRAHTARDTVSGKAFEARGAVSRAPMAAKQKAQGNPLAAGVIAFGLGMLVSSLIPAAEKERQAVSRLQENLVPVKEKASEVAREVAENLKEPAQEAAQSVKAAATEGAQNVKQEGAAAAAEIKDQAQASKETVQQQRS
jgi:hypothetical protein